MKQFDPPEWAIWLLRKICPRPYQEEVEGDLKEAFYWRLEEKGARVARRRFWIETLKTVLLIDFKQPLLMKELTRTPIVNYVKTALRHFAANRGYSLINLGGLVIGITSCFLIGLYILQELSYDRFHPHKGQQYRVVMDMYGNGELKVKSAVVYPAVGPALVKEFPEVEAYTRMLPFANGVYSRPGGDGELIRFNETKAVLADANFFEIFGFELRSGNPAEVLAKKDQIVLSESTARRYFGDEDPIGQTMNWRGRHPLVVSGVMADFPPNSHMEIDIIASLKTWDGFEQMPENWGWYDFYTFIRLRESADRLAFEQKLSGFLDIKKAAEYEKSLSREVLWLQPLEDIHLYSSGLGWDMGQNGGAYQVYFLAAVALLILIIAWINFVNLSSARAVKRAKEVGIRKVVGASKSQLIYQFLTEAFLYNLVAIFFAGVLLRSAIPLLNRLLDTELNVGLLTSSALFPILLVSVFAGALFSGAYPAYVLSSFKPLNVLKAKFYNRRSKFGFRQVLVTFQFTASILLILGTFIVIKQLRFMQSMDLGMNIEQTLVLRSPSSSSGEDDLSNRLALFKERLREIPAVKGIAVSSIVPGIENFSISGMTSRYFPNEYRDCYRVRIDENFVEDFEIEVMAGRNFSRNMSTDTAAVLLNEIAVAHLGFEGPEAALGEKINPGRRSEHTIVGVLENYHQGTAHEAMDPVVFFYRPNASGFYSLKIQSQDYGRVLAAIDDRWNEIYPDNPLEHFFLDEHFALQYQSDQRFNLVFAAFAMLAIIVACLGLFGLVSFTTEQSRKEIGIRKVMGATVRSLITHLTRDYARLILWAMLIAFPLGYLAMRRWLQGFAYRTQIGADIFLLGALVIVFIAVLTISFKSYQAAVSNPAQVLRSD